MNERIILNKYGEDILYLAIAKHFYSLSYSVGVKVKVNSEEADVLCVKNSRVVIIEVKKFFSWNAWKNSLKYRDYCNELYFAAGAESFKESDSLLKQHIIEQLSQNGCGLILVDFINSKLDFLIKPKSQTPTRTINSLSIRLQRRNWLKWCNLHFPWYININEENLLRFIQKYKTVTKMEILSLFDKKDQPKVFSLLDKLTSDGKLYKYYYPVSWRTRNEKNLSY